MTCACSYELVYLVHQKQQCIFIAHLTYALIGQHFDYHCFFFLSEQQQKRHLTWQKGGPHFCSLIRPFHDNHKIEQTQVFEVMGSRLGFLPDCELDLSAVPLYSCSWRLADTLGFTYVTTAVNTQMCLHTTQSYTLCRMSNHTQLASCKKIITNTSTY